MRPRRDVARRTARSVARLAAVQGLYQVDLAGTDAERVLEELESWRPDARLDGADGADAEAALLAALVRDAARRLPEIDAIIRRSLSDSWKVERLAYVLRAILRTAVSELQAFPETPARVVISEYLDVAHAYFGAAEVGMANGVLDDVARTLRPDEFGGAEERNR